MSFEYKAKFYRVFGEIDSCIFGTFVLKNIDWDNNQGEIGFSLLDKYQSKGLGAAMVYKSLANIFSSSLIENVFGTVSVDNEACKRLMLSFGFEDQGLYPQKLMVNNVPTAQIVYFLSKSRSPVFQGSSV